MLSHLWAVAACLRPAFGAKKVHRTFSLLHLTLRRVSVAPGIKAIAHRATHPKPGHKERRLSTW